MDEHIEKEKNKKEESSNFIFDSVEIFSDVVVELIDSILD